MRRGDRLVSEEIQLIPAETSRSFAGKAAGRHHLRQGEIDDLLLRLIHSGRSASRAGTPSSSAGAKKPSISPAITCPSRWFWPNTVHFITGHAKDDGEIDYDRSKLVDADCALLIYMGPGTPGAWPRP